MSKQRHEALKRWLSISLLVNIIVIGGAAGWIVRHVFFPPERPPFHAMEEALREGLPEETLRPLDTRMHAFHASRKILKRQFMAERKQMSRALSQEPFDPAAFQAILTANRQKREAQMQEMAKEISGIAALLPVEKRQLLARYFTPPPHDRQKRGKGCPGGK